MSIVSPARRMGAFLTPLALSACATVPAHDKVTIVEFQHDRFEAVARKAYCERWLATMELLNTGYCALPLYCPIDFNDLKRWAEVGAAAKEIAQQPPPPTPPPSVFASLPSVPHDSGWKLDIYGVSITPLEDRSALRVETRFGDWGGMDRVVAWLEQCGGRRVP